MDEKITQNENNTKNNIFPNPEKMPNKVGLGFKIDHVDDIKPNHKTIGWFEIHPENYMVKGGFMLYALEKIRRDYPISMHGVGLSIGGTKPLNKIHLQKFKDLIDRFQPTMISEHLAWSSHDEAFLNDLLPLPYNMETLNLVAEHIEQMQNTLKMKVLIENPSTYLCFENSDMSETEFLSEIARKTGCGLLLDINNVHVSAHNNQYNPYQYIDKYPHQHIGEVHLGGHHIDKVGDEHIIIDSHKNQVAEKVWQLYEYTIDKIGKKPVLIEWDSDIPPFDTLEAEAKMAYEIMYKKTKTTQIYKPNIQAQA